MFFCYEGYFLNNSLPLMISLKFVILGLDPGIQIVGVKCLER